MTGIWRARAAVLILLGTLVVHGGRYFLAPPEHHGFSSAHGYFSWFAPLVVALVFLVILQLGKTILNRRSTTSTTLPRAGILWPLLTATILVGHIAQESVEGFVAHGHLPHLFADLATGGWVMLPLAMVAGLGATLLLKGAVSLERWVVLRERPMFAFAPRIATPAQRAPWGLSTSVLARRLAGRAPPRSI